jgi:hypothetical protein
MLEMLLLRLKTCQDWKYYVKNLHPYKWPNEMRAIHNILIYYLYLANLANMRFEEVLQQEN